jgi:hypothetical protein
MAPRGTELGRRVNGRVELRRDAVRLRLRLGDIPTADIHLIDVDFNASVRPLDERGEREMFEETFLNSRDAAGVDDIAAHFTPALHRAMCGLARTQPAEHWLAESSKQAVIDGLRAAAKPVAFACGVELLPPFDLVVTSRTLQREKLDEMERTLSQRRLAGQVENVQRAAELLREFSTLRQAMPELAAGQLLEHVAPANRGSMLQSLLMASATSATARLWAVAGTSLLTIDPRSRPSSPSATTTELPADLGPLRSVQADGDRLLIGAQTGVMIVDPHNSREVVLLRDPRIASQLGFNSVARTGSIVWASHSDGGVVWWDIDDVAKPRGTFADAKHARNLITLDDKHVIFSTKDAVFVGEIDESPAMIASTPSPVLLIHAGERGIDLVRSNGEVETLDRQTLQRKSLQRRAGELSAAGTLPFLGSSRLLLASSDGPIHCVGGDDTLMTQYLSIHRGLRAVAACADVVAALSGDRQRIVLWQSWAGESPAGEIHVGAAARHRAADICFG